MTHKEEAAQHDISKLQDKVHQISLSQRAIENEIEVLKKGVEAKMDGLKKVMEAKMDGMEARMEARMDDMEANIDEKMKDNMEDMKNDLKSDMEGLMTMLIQKMIPNGGKIIEETNDENKINVNRDFISSNVGLKNHHIPKKDMRKFYLKDS